MSNWNEEEQLQPGQAYHQQTINVNGVIKTIMVPITVGVQSTIKPTNANVIGQGDRRPKPASNASNPIVIPDQPDAYSTVTVAPNLTISNRIPIPRPVCATHARLPRITLQPMTRPRIILNRTPAAPVGSQPSVMRPSQVISLPESHKPNILLGGSNVRNNSAINVRPQVGSVAAKLPGVPQRAQITSNVRQRVPLQPPTYANARIRTPGVRANLPIFKPPTSQPVQIVVQQPQPVAKQQPSTILHQTATSSSQQNKQTITLFLTNDGQFKGVDPADQALAADLQNALLPPANVITQGASPAVQVHQNIASTPLVGTVLGPMHPQVSGMQQQPAQTTILNSGQVVQTSSAHGGTFIPSMSQLLTLTPSQPVKSVPIQTVNTQVMPVLGAISNPAPIQINTPYIINNAANASSSIVIVNNNNASSNVQFGSNVLNPSSVAPPALTKLITRPNAAPSKVKTSGIDGAKKETSKGGILPGKSIPRLNADSGKPNTSTAEQKKAKQDLKFDMLKMDNVAKRLKNISSKFQPIRSKTSVDATIAAQLEELRAQEQLEMETDSMPVKVECDSDTGSCSTVDYDPDDFDERIGMSPKKRGKRKSTFGRKNDSQKRRRYYSEVDPMNEKKKYGLDDASVELLKQCKPCTVDCVNIDLRQRFIEVNSDLVVRVVMGLFPSHLSEDLSLMACKACRKQVERCWSCKPFKVHRKQLDIILANGGWVNKSKSHKKKVRRFGKFEVPI